MRTLQDYRDIYRKIAQSLGYRGDGTELLIQLLSNATYIEEVENITYVEEASLERATLMNSKIQHCMDLMYSVYRGACPRVLFHIRPTKYQSFAPFQEIATSANFKVYYLGFARWKDIYGDSSDWWQKRDLGEDLDPLGIETGIQFSNLILNPLETDSSGETESYLIYGFISESGPIVKEHQIGVSNPYYFDTPETGLSGDMFLEVSKFNKKTGDLENYKRYPVTRVFSDHILNDTIYDLTMPGFGSRLYFPGILEESDRIRATYYKLAYLDSFLPNELKRITLKGATLLPFDDLKESSERKFYESHDILDEYFPGGTDSGLIIIPETPREDLQSIHYNANRNRYMNSIVRSNTDMGSLLEEMYPNKVRAGGTTCRYQGNSVVIYYIPRSNSNLLTSDESLEFVSSRQAYYITSSIQVRRALELRRVVVVDLELYQASDTIEASVENILNPYQSKFGIDLSTRGDDGNSNVLNEIKSTLAKIPEVRYIKGVVLNSLDQHDERETTVPYYYTLSCVINTSITK